MEPHGEVHGAPSSSDLSPASPCTAWCSGLRSSSQRVWSDASIAVYLESQDAFRFPSSSTGEGKGAAVQSHHNDAKVTTKTMAPDDGGGQKVWSPSRYFLLR